MTASRFRSFWHFVISLIVLCCTVQAQALTFYSQGTADITDQTNWNTNRTGAGTNAFIAGVTAMSTGHTWVAQNGHTLTIDGTNNHDFEGDFQIESGATINLNGGLGASFNSTTLSGVTVLHDGGIFNYNTSGSAALDPVLILDNSFTISGNFNRFSNANITQTNGTTTVTATGIYSHTFDGGEILASTWHTDAVCNVTSNATTLPNGLNQSFGTLNLTLAGLNGTTTHRLPDNFQILSNLNVHGLNNRVLVCPATTDVTIGNRLTIDNGTLQLDATRTLTINGILELSHVNGNTVGLNINGTCTVHGEWLIGVNADIDITGDFHANNLINEVAGRDPADFTISGNYYQNKGTQHPIGVWSNPAAQLFINEVMNAQTFTADTYPQVTISALQQTQDVTIPNNITFLGDVNINEFGNRTLDFASNTTFNQSLTIDKVNLLSNGALFTANGAFNLNSPFSCFQTAKLHQGATLNAGGKLTVALNAELEVTGGPLNNTNASNFIVHGSYEQTLDNTDIPTAAYQTTSTLKIIDNGNVGPATASFAQQFGEVYVTFTGLPNAQSITLPNAFKPLRVFRVHNTGDGTLALAAGNHNYDVDFIIDNGQFIINNLLQTNALNVTGDLIINGGVITVNNSPAGGNGSFALQGDLNINGNGRFQINNSAAISFGTFTMSGATNLNINDNGEFIINAGALGTGTLNTPDDFSLSARIQMNTNAIGGGIGVLNVNGNLNLLPGSEIEGRGGSLLGNAEARLNFTRQNTSLPQLFTNNGSITENLNVRVLPNSIVEFANPTTLLTGFTGDFTIEDEGGLIIKHPEGIEASGDAGCVRNTGDRIFPTGGRYSYAVTGTNNETGGGLPDSITDNGYVAMNMATASDQVLLSKDLAMIGTSFTLVQGFLVLDEANLTIDKNGTLAGGNVNSYVKTINTGSLIKRGIGTSTTGNFKFHVGKSSYNPVIINNDDAGADGDFAVRVCLDAINDDGCLTTGDFITFAAVKRVWDINHIGGSANVGLTLEWDNSTDILPFFDVNGCSINHHNGTEWEIQPSYTNIPQHSHHNFFGAVNVGGNRYQRTAYNVQSFSPFGISSGSGPLPAQLISFNAQINDESILSSNWVTASEINVEQFSVQVKVGVDDFKTIDIVPAIGNTTEQQTYSSAVEIDLKNTEVIYARLKIRDFDGYIEYSDLVAIENNQEIPKVRVSPNPFEQDLEIQVSVQQQSTCTIKMIDFAGNQVINRSEKAQKGVNRYKLNRDLEEGMYQLIIQVDDYLHVEKLLRNSN